MWCWWLLCAWWFLIIHGENLLPFIIRSFWINTCMVCCCGVIFCFIPVFLLGCDVITMSHRPLRWLRSPSITTYLSFILYIFCLLRITLQKLSHNWLIDNMEELFNPCTIVAMFSAGDTIIGSGREPYFLTCNMPTSGIIIIGSIGFFFVQEVLIYFYDAMSGCFTVYL